MKLSTHLDHCSRSADPSMQHSLLRTPASDIPKKIYRADIVQTAWFLTLILTSHFQALLCQQLQLEGSSVVSDIFMFAVLTEGTE